MYSWMSALITVYDYSVAVDGGIYKGACLYRFVV